MADRYVDYLPLDQIEPAPRNPKQHDQDGIARSIGHFGLGELPLLDDRTGRLVAGHGRYQQLTTLRASGAAPPDGVRVDESGRWLMPVVRGWASRSDDDAEAYLVASNQLTIGGGWDDRALVEMLTDLADAQLLELTGFDDDDFTTLVAGLGDASDGGMCRVGDAEARRSLAERFGVPPFTVLDARQGYWQDRKKAWLALGLRSEEGRQGGLVGGMANAGEIKTRISGQQFDGTGWQAGTSIFDPVLCELLVRWYSAPGHRVLDPFAGGSVRGIVCALLDRRYLGVDLSSEQVAVNVEQADRILTTAAPVVVPDFTPDLTPIEEHGGYLVKRDDAWCRDGASGAKSRTLFALAAGTGGIITAGARRSPQIERAALVAAALGIGCRVHVPAGNDTPEIETCRSAGAEVIKHTAGRLSVLRARFREDTAAHHGWLSAPFGMGIDDYAEDVAAQVANIPTEVTRIVVPCGSGMTAAGILRGLDKRDRSHIRILAVSVGHEPTEYLDTFGPPDWRHRVDIVETGLDFDTDAPTTTLGDLPLDPMYEAKCLPYLRDGDLLWCVGIRHTSPRYASPNPAAGNATPPRWIVGDSRDITTLVPASEHFDLMLTCPPYFNLEVYSDNPADLSCCVDYPAFLAGYRECLAAASDRMAANAFAAIVTGALRDRHGYILDLPADTTRIMEDLGWRLYQDAVLATVPSTAAIRAGRTFALRKLTRTHQMIGVYHRGDIKAVRDWPAAEVGDEKLLPQDDSRDDA